MSNQASSKFGFTFFSLFFLLFSWFCPASDSSSLVFSLEMGVCKDAKCLYRLAPDKFERKMEFLAREKPVLCFLRINNIDKSMTSKV